MNYPPPYGQPAPINAAASGSETPWVKIILLVFGGFFLLCALTVGGMIWFGYKAKDYVTEQAKERGIDLEKMAEKQPASRRVDPCTLLTKAEASRILGVELERADANGEQSCSYFAKAADLEAAQKAANEREGGANAPVEEVTKSILGGMGGGEGAYMSVGVDWEDGMSNLTAFRIALELLGPNMSSKLSGLGDQAFLGPMDSMLLFRKGATGVTIDLRMVPKGREKGIEIARTILSRLKPE